MRSALMVDRKHSANGIGSMLDTSLESMTDGMARIAGGAFRMGSDSHYPESDRLTT
jgi:hypothetical protein